MFKQLVLFAVVGGLVFAPAPAAQADFTAPDNLNDGDIYHAAFMTSDIWLIDALSSDIEVYNAKVMEAAAASTVSGVPGLKWKALVSTEAVSAAENLELRGPVYDMGETTEPPVVLATGDAGPGILHTTELGTDEWCCDHIWTGTGFSMEADYPLGTGLYPSGPGPGSQHGEGGWAFDRGWPSGVQYRPGPDNMDTSSLRHLYAVSEPLVVVDGEGLPIRVPAGTLIMIR